MSGNTTSTGHHASAADWLDLHFESHRPAYESILRMAGIEQGWHVLDAGCGGGNYLPWIAENVGGRGQVTAMDLAPENVSIVRERLAGWDLPCPIEAVEGSVLDLPFADDSFDAVWCANVEQYLPDDEFKEALREFHRVTRPGGLVAIKDVDLGLAALYPGDPGLFRRWFEARWQEPGWTQAKGGLSRCWIAQRFLERAGFLDVWQRTSAIELRAPLNDVQHEFIKQLLSSFAQVVTTVENTVSEADHAAWTLLADASHPDHPLNHPDFYYREGQMLAVGRVPARPHEGKSTR